jgi:hypothetical protein
MNGVSSFFCDNLFCLSPAALEDTEAQRGKSNKINFKLKFWLHLLVLPGRSPPNFALTLWLCALCEKPSVSHPLRGFFLPGTTHDAGSTIFINMTGNYHVGYLPEGQTWFSTDNVVSGKEFVLSVSVGVGLWPILFFYLENDF